MTARADVDALYRDHAPAITASLARVFGAHRLDVIEAGVHEAFVAAIERWKDPAAVPTEPGAWLTTVARRRVIDTLRRAAWFAPQGDRELDALALEAPDPGDAHGDQALLAMLFVCCHPALARFGYRACSRSGRGVSDRRREPVRRARRCIRGTHGQSVPGTASELRH